MQDKPSYQKVYNFSNGWGASVVCSDMSYGNRDRLFELAVLRGEKISYESGITKDVIGFLDFQEVADLLKKIEALPDQDEISGESN